MDVVDLADERHAGAEAAGQQQRTALPPGHHLRPAQHGEGQQALAQQYRQKGQCRTGAARQVIPVVRHDEDDAQAHQQAAQDGEQKQHARAAALIRHGIFRTDALRLLRVQQTVTQQFRQGFGEAGIAHGSGKGTEREEEWRNPHYCTVLLRDLQEQEVTPTSGRRVACGSRHRRRCW